MERIEICLRFLSQCLDMPVFRCEKTEEVLRRYTGKHCFLPKVQQMITPEALELIADNLKPRIIYKTHDSLGIHMAFFLLEGQMILVGPWVEKMWDEQQAESILIELELPLSYILPYRHYYCDYNVIQDKSVLHIISSAITALYPEEPVWSRRDLRALPYESSHTVFREVPFDFNRAVLQYEKENRFIKCIEEGDSKAAIKAYRKLSTTPFEMKLLTSAPRTFIASASVLRTLVRKATERAGVHPAIVDAISQSYAQKMYAATEREDISRMFPDMIEEFCHAVRQAKAERYSSAVGKVVDYIRLHVSQSISLETLAATAGISANYLSHIFKKETGVSVSQYIARTRCEKAAELLVRTDLPVQEISRYVGYLDNNYFVKVFRKQYLMTPTEYRGRKTL